MGFLHEGHVSLILDARDECDIVIVSIFVNPSQFLPGEDFAQYPRDFLRDYHICKSSGADYIFYPSDKDVYPESYFTFVNVDTISDRLEGIYRPGHFRGVATVVLKLFNMTKPHFAYFGQKDAQQCVIIKKMTRDLNVDVSLRICDTIREENGLAKSSRNTYLSNGEKEEASSIYKMLREGKDLVLENKFKSTKDLKDYLEWFLGNESKNIKLQYIAVTDNENLDEIEDLSVYKGEVLISLAAYMGNREATRLIDNILFNKTG